MLYLVIILVALGLVTALFTLFSRSADSTEAPVPVQESCNTCNGENDKCEQECMMEAAIKDIEYYDDEELDAFRGRESDTYTEQEVEQFSEVLYTMRPDEVKGWTRSLTLRGVNLPNQLKDEVFALTDNL
ncbi:hypothetical protein JHU38_07285 [Prevotella sp. A2931]|uniref:Phospholipase n=1 Tax=Prevotella illustrans TaxID=2800387 RepID=A0ABS3M5W3_9BACT|nr:MULTISPECIES: hypothetical protein [Prevotella]MBO1363572.1 hypothetical protein [Prevotella illustrans]PTL26200.1 hypothetical protein C3V39_03495 [Prevotella sp. oral taxon 820]